MQEHRKEGQDVVGDGTAQRKDGNCEVMEKDSKEG